MAYYIQTFSEYTYFTSFQVYLIARGALLLIGALIQKEIKKLMKLEETTMNLHLQQGYALKELTG